LRRPALVSKIPNIRTSKDFLKKKNLTAFFDRIFLDRKVKI
jgi:hypothetical protein